MRLREKCISRAYAYRKLFLRRVGGPSNGKCVGFDFGHRRELSSIEWGYARAAESSQVFADIYAEKMSGMPIMHGFFYAGRSFLELWSKCLDCALRGVGKLL